MQQDNEEVQTAKQAVRELQGNEPSPRPLCCASELTELRCDADTLSAHLTCAQPT